MQSGIESLHPEARRHYRRNFALGVANGAIYAVAEALQDPTLVLSVFISRLTGSVILVGLLMPLCIGGWYLPQLLFSGRVQASPTKMRYYHSSGVARVLANTGLVVVALWVRQPGLLAALVFLLIAANALSGGLSGLAFTNTVGKVIPSRRRGRFFGLRAFFGGMLVFVGSLLARHLLTEPPGLAFPTNYAVIFGIAAAAVLLSFLCFATVREHADEVLPPRVGVREQLRRAAELPRRSPAFRNFLVTRCCLMFVEVAAPFYIIYAHGRFGVPVAMTGTYLVVSAVANIISTYAWSRVSDNSGNRATLRLACVVGGLVPCLALLVLPLTGLAPGAGTPVAVVVFGLLFAFLGASRTGVFIGGTNYLLDVAPADDRPIYIGLSNTLVGVASLATAVGGVVVATAGYEPLFLVALALYLAAGIAITRATEPRESGIPAPNPTQ
ncbi:MAG: MFS transporter [Anaerolineae bacterium]